MLIGPITSLLNSVLRHQNHSLSIRTHRPLIKSSSIMAALPILAFWEKQPPLAVAAASKLSGFNMDIKADAKGSKDTVTTLTLPDGEHFSGSPLILRFVARSANGEALGLCGRDALSATQIDYWIDYATQNASAGANFEAVCNGINDYLALRSFIVGYSVSAADLALWGQLQGERA